MAFKKRPIRRIKKVYKKRVSKPKAVSVAIKKYVKSTIHRQIENKSFQINGGVSFGNVNESPDFNAYPMAPLLGFWSISNGLGQGNRIGNKIQIRKVMLNYILRPTPYDATFNPLPGPSHVQLFLGHIKSAPSALPASSDVNQLFQSGNSVTAHVGTLRDIISVINTDYWTIKKRWTHKVGYASATGTGGVAAAQYNANNDFKLNVVKRIDITKMLPAKYQFNDNSITPTSKNLFFMFYAVSSTGAAYSATDLPVNIEFWLDYHFEDA